MYAEEQQNARSKLTYLRHGVTTQFPTFFLDRAKYRLSEGVSNYENIFWRGVVVSLCSPQDLYQGAPPIPLKRAEAYEAYESWLFPAKQRLHPGDSLPPNRDINSSVHSEAKAATYQATQTQSHAPLDLDILESHDEQEKNAEQMLMLTNDQQPMAQHDPDSPLVPEIDQKLVRMTSSLGIVTGKLTLKAEIGFLCLTNIKGKYVCAMAENVRDRSRSLRKAKMILDKHRFSSEDVIFTNILTGEGADANSIAYIFDNESGKRVWRGQERRSIYEVSCFARLKNGEHCSFIIEIDAMDFSYEVYRNCDASRFLVHCPERTKDIQVTLSKAQDLRDTFGGFVQDLIDRMEVV